MKSFHLLVSITEIEDQDAYNLVLDAIGFGPSAHDPGVVERDDHDKVDTLGLDLGKVLNEARQVLSGTAWSECAYSVQPWSQLDMLQST